MVHKLLQDFVLLLVGVNPALVVPEFVAVTAKFDHAAKRRIAFEAVAIAGGILLAFTAVGQAVLAALDIKLHAFQIAAGLILLLMSLRMVLEESVHPDTATGRYPAVHPLAIPYIANPKSIMTVLLLTDSATQSIHDQLRVGMLVLIVLALALASLLGAHWVHRFLRDTGISIISRVMGLILAALATQYMLTAFEQAFHFTS